MISRQRMRTLEHPLKLWRGLCSTWILRTLIFHNRLLSLCSWCCLYWFQLLEYSMFWLLRSTTSCVFFLSYFLAFSSFRIHVKNVFLQLTETYSRLAGLTRGYASLNRARLAVEFESHLSMRFLPHVQTLPFHLCELCIPRSAARE